MIRTFKLYELLKSGVAEKEHIRDLLQSNEYMGSLYEMMYSDYFCHALTHDADMMTAAMDISEIRTVAGNSYIFKKKTLDTGDEGALNAFLAAVGGYDGVENVFDFDELAGRDIMNQYPIGVELDGSTWRNIDYKGRPLSARWNAMKDFYKCFRGIHDVEVDGQAMVEIPKFHFLYQQTSTGHRWWIAPDQFTIPGVGTSSVHKGFVYNGVEKPWFQVGAYEASQDISDSTKNASVVGRTPIGNMYIANHLANCNNRGNGFGMINVWQHGAVRLLCLIDAGTADVTSVFGYGNCDNSNICACGASNAVWRGVHEFWGNLGCFVDKCTPQSGYYYLTDDAGGSIQSNTGVAYPSTVSWNYITEFSPKYLEEGLFLPTAHSGSDPWKWGNDGIWLSVSGTAQVSFGGRYGVGAKIGLFSTVIETINNPPAFNSPLYGTRLSRVA